MGQRVVKMLLLGLMMAVLTVLREVRSDPVLYEQAEPSHHVMHIRKLTDSDRLKIELEPVWFHLESAEQAAGESQQVKRQTKQHPGRPVQVFSNLKHLERYRRKNRYESEPEAESAQQKHSSTESYLKDFWHADVPSDKGRSHEAAPKTSASLEQQLDDIELPSCFRKYLHEMYDRNSESVRKLMRCLGQESRLEERRTGRLPAYRDRYDRDGDDPHQALYGRKVIRRRKFTDQHEKAPSAPVAAAQEEDLKFEQHYIRSDSDDGGHVFTPATDDSVSESNDSNASSSSEEGADDNYVRSQTEESPEEPERRQQPRYGEPYRRPPPKYNTQQRRRDSMESEEDCSCEGSESCEHC